MSRYLLLVILVLVAICKGTVRADAGSDPIRWRFIDKHGREYIPRGFVFSTDDLTGKVDYTEKDYVRAARMGANFQVIRLDITRIGGWPGYKPMPAYLQQLDRMVETAAKFGMKTAFKLTFYRIPGFKDKKEAFWKDDDGVHEAIIRGWSVLWRRYKDNPDVFGYDLLNEPEIGPMHDIGYECLQAEYLMPMYRKLIDRLREIDTVKWALFQPILLEPNPDGARAPIPFYEMKESIGRDKVIFAPHIYQLGERHIMPTFRRYLKEAGLSDAPLLIGEWGSSTFRKTDVTLIEQQRYQRAYIHTAEICDSLGLGMVKAWFMGSRWEGKSRNDRFTWSIFRDNKAVGTTERKYITDIIARPYPRCVAGRLNRFRYDFAQRILTVEFISGSQASPTELFIGANRHYPDGFTLTINDRWKIAFDPLEEQGLIYDANCAKTIKAEWDSQLQKLLIYDLPTKGEKYTVKIEPGIFPRINK